MASRALAQEGEELGLLARAQVFELKQAIGDIRRRVAMAIRVACEDCGIRVPLGRVERVVRNFDLGTR